MFSQISGQYMVCLITACGTQDKQRDNRGHGFAKDIHDIKKVRFSNNKYLFYAALATQ